jgi:hypothetical protein
LHRALSHRAQRKEVRNTRRTATTEKKSLIEVVVITAAIIFLFPDSVSSCTLCSEHRTHQSASEFACLVRFNCSPISKVSVANQQVFLILSWIFLKTNFDFHAEA